MYHLEKKHSTTNCWHRRSSSKQYILFTCWTLPVDFFPPLHAFFRTFLLLSEFVLWCVRARTYMLRTNFFFSSSTTFCASLGHGSLFRPLCTYLPSFFAACTRIPGRFQDHSHVWSNFIFFLPVARCLLSPIATYLGYLMPGNNVLTIQIFSAITRQHELDHTDQEYIPTRYLSIWSICPGNIYYGRE